MTRTFLDIEQENRRLAAALAGANRQLARLRMVNRVLTGIVAGGLLGVLVLALANFIADQRLAAHQAAATPASTSIVKDVARIRP